MSIISHLIPYVEYMTLAYKQVDNKDELQQILALQKRNLPDQLSADEREQEGFVTVSHTLELLERMNNRCPHIIAKEKGKVVGYALCMHPFFAGEIEVLKPMFAQIKSLGIPSENYLVMGQICIDKDYRGRGVFRRLYAEMKKVVQPVFGQIITEVDAANNRSLQAHYAIGFKELKAYEVSGRIWHLITLS